MIVKPTALGSCILGIIRRRRRSSRASSALPVAFGQVPLNRAASWISDRPTASSIPGSITSTIPFV